MAEEAAAGASRTREMKAMTLNMKEQRILQKRLQTLKLEESFRVKSLNLDKKQIKVFQKRLCTNVGKIKSYLSAEDISFMKTLEMQGRFKPEYNSVYISNAMTIIAAAKRLKLLSNDEIKEITQDLNKSDDELIPCTPREEKVTPRNKSAPQRIRPPRPPTSTAKVSEEIIPLDVNRNASRTNSASNRNSRSRSLPPPETNRSRPPTASSRLPSTAAMANKLPQLPDNSRSNTDLDSVDGSSMPRSRSSSRSRVSEQLDEAATMFRPTSSVNRISRQSSARPRSRFDQSRPLPGSETTREHPSQPMARPLTTGGYLTARPRTSRNSPIRPNTTLAIGLDSPSLNYSSHKTVTLQQPKNRTGRSCRRISVMSSSSLGSEMAKEKAEEKRKELLVGEQNRCDHIEEKRQVFLSRISKWVEENPAIVDPQKPKYAFINSSDIEMMKANADVQVIRKEGIFEEDEDKGWKDLKKCRYLRLNDDEIDLSGITTLAKDQLQMLQGFRINYDLPRRPDIKPAAVEG